MILRALGEAASVPAQPLQKPYGIADFDPDAVGLPVGGLLARRGSAEAAQGLPVQVRAKKPPFVRVFDASDGLGELFVPGWRVLGIGSGTGFHAALLAARLGEENVISVGVDGGLIVQARANLRRAGRAPTVHPADGALGWAAGALFDRVNATCAVRTARRRG
ncbi:hypothetical protein [Streptomyces buecherae]|uniref:hypothetical protein n=1 Tax=Streptomyces buecherae TaxID=2763006 RepID=UPI001C266B91|nr:hypothetical protein [Streptomyces buecherae]